MANIIFTHRARKDWDRLETSAKQRILSTFREMEGDPLAGARKLTDSKLGTYRMRAGDYRIVFDVEGEDVVILRIGHRSNIYQ
ncbi:MAG TPA: type II toxin-antitoxin system RelE/ParE family toxin [Candidatus Lokiarchaeia archaeon]|nr:type II toxin-antitoxin system RelE/ParE family toxin [Candidatus Lokiarchaeia archaeon]